MSVNHTLFNADTLTWQFDYIANFWNQYFGWFLHDIFHYTYDYAINSMVLEWSVWLVVLMLFLSFVVGFIFISRK